MNKEYKQIEFNINTAKDIMHCKVDGEVRTLNGHKVQLYDLNVKGGKLTIAGKIIYDDSEKVTMWTKKGEHIDYYSQQNNLVLLVKEEHIYKHFDRILVETFDASIQDFRWVCRFFSHYSGGMIITTNGTSFVSNKVRPYEGNEYLVENL